MPKIEGLNHERAEDIWRMLARESGDAAESTPEAPAADGPPSAQDIALGRELFRGQRTLANGGAACQSCHTVAGLETWGGALGPDLTGSINRLGGRRGLTAWMQRPQTPNMQASFKLHPLDPAEIQALTAFLENASPSAPEASPRLLYVSLFGVAGCVVGLVIFDFAWKQRLRAVRKLVAKKRTRGDKA